MDRFDSAAPRRKLIAGADQTAGLSHGQFAGNRVARSGAD